MIRKLVRIFLNKCRSLRPGWVMPGTNAAHWATIRPSIRWHPLDGRYTCVAGHLWMRHRAVRWTRHSWNGACVFKLPLRNRDDFRSFKKAGPFWPNALRWSAFLRAPDYSILTEKLDLPGLEKTFSEWKASLDRFNSQCPVPLNENPKLSWSPKTG